MVDAKELDAIVYMFDTAYANGFGFQCTGASPHGSLVVAWLVRFDQKTLDEDQLTQQLCTEFKTEHIKVGDYLARKFLQVHWTMYDKIPAILQYILDLDMYSFWLQNTLDVSYPPGSRFLPHLVEKLYVQRFKEQVQHWQRRGDSEDKAWHTQMMCCGSKRSNLLCRFNWQTEIGQAFCQELHTRFGNRVEEWGYETKDETRYNYFQFVNWKTTAQKYQLFQFCPVWWWAPVPPKPQIEVALPPSCVICLDEPANTLVIPCGHCSVCVSCSKQLAAKRGIIPDATVCVTCRQPFSCILYDE